MGWRSRSERYSEPCTRPRSLGLRSYLDVQTPNPLPRPRGAASLVAVGDIACPGGARRTPATCRYAETAALAGYLNPNVVAVLGDNQYYAGAIGPYAEAFDATWGLLKSRMRPAVGNHEYLTSAAADYFTYFGPVARPPNGYYSYNLGTWHIVVLNSNCTIVACGAGSPQESWLRGDLASHPRRCTLAYFHHPRFSSASHCRRSGATSTAPASTWC